jgi:hypothetical protein
LRNELATHNLLNTLQFSIQDAARTRHEPARALPRSVMIFTELGFRSAE